MKEKNEIIIESVAQKAAETAKALRMCSQPELLADAVKVVKKQIPFRYRRYAAAWLLMQAASDEVSDSKTQPRKTTKKRRRKDSSIYSSDAANEIVSLPTL